MTKVAVFGPSGMLGRQVIKQLALAGHEAQPVYRRMFELLDRSSVERSVEGCEAVINCAGIIPIRNTDIVEMVRVNSEFPHLLVSCGVARTILVSTDCVFSGRSTKRYTVNSLPDPRDYYGRSKALGEVLAPNSLVVRTSFIGCEHGFMSWILGAGVVASATGQRQQVEGWKNALWTGSTVTEVARGLVAYLDDSLWQAGIVHLSTEQVVNKHDLAVKIIETRKLNLEVKPCYQPVLNRALEPTQVLLGIDLALKEYECSGAVA